MTLQSKWRKNRTCEFEALKKALAEGESLLRSFDLYQLYLEELLHAGLVHCIRPQKKKRKEKSSEVAQS